MRILILNWRCPRNPRAGGAELVTLEVARRLVRWGHSVEWFSADFPGALPVEEIDGIVMRRAGRQATVHWHAFIHYRSRLRGSFDIVIDQINTFPFFTTLWSDIPVFMLIHQLAREVWWYESRFPVSLLGYILEPLYLRCYRNANVFTVSESTKVDLRGMGFKGRIVVVPEGLEPISVTARAKPTTPTFLYVGRLAPSKRVAHVITAFASFTRTVAPAYLSIVGAGRPKYVESLRRLAQRLGVGDSVSFVGWIPANEKHDLMAASHMLLVASVREGWGLVVLEANACGTPAIVYDVPGLRDAVRNEETGLVVPSSPDQLAQAMRRLWSDREKYRQMALQSVDWSRLFSFDITARIIEQELAHVLAA